jgi:glycosyltransferase involved in cell wall biosynthesis
MASDKAPFISVIVPTLNRPGPLAECLSAMTAQDCPAERFEVIVVDDESKRGMEEVVSSFRDRIDIRLLRQRRAGPGPARNTGAGVARGELFAFADDDSRPQKDWLIRLRERSLAWPGHVIGGRTINALADNIYSAASQMLIDVLYAHYNLGTGGPTFFAGNNIAVPAQGFRALKGFDPGFHLSAAEDRDFCERWLASGRNMVYAPEAVVFHAHHLTLRKLWRQHFNYGRGAHRFYQVRRRRRMGHTRPQPGLYPRLLRAPFASSALPRACVLAGLLVLTQVAHTFGYVRELVGLEPKAPAAEC